MSQERRAKYKDNQKTRNTLNGEKNLIVLN